MAIRWLKTAALAIALCAPLGACNSNGPTTPEQAQYLSTLRPCQPGTHPISFPSGHGGGYRCVLNDQP